MAKLDKLQEEIAKAKELEQIYAKTKKHALGRISAMQQSLEVMGKEEELIARQTKNEEWLNKQATARNTTVANIVKDQQKLLKQKEKESAILEYNLELETKRTTTMRESLAAAQDLSKTLGDSFKSSNAVDLKKYLGMAGQLVDVFRGGPKSVWEFTKSLGSGMLLGAVSTIIGEIIKLTLDVDKLGKSFRKGTLASKQMASQVQGVYRSMIPLGASTEEVAAAAGSLYSNMTDFTKLTAAEQNNLLANATTFEKLGIGSETYAQGLQTATTSFSMSMEEAEYAMRDITTFSQELQLDARKVAEEFAAAGPALAKFGDQTQTFKELQRVMKITGMEMEDILSVANKFDTFEGAAEQAGKLNAALGGNFVNAMDLMMATDPAERFEMIRDAITDTGLSFTDMSYYQKQFYAESAGLDSVDKLAKMMKGDMSAGADATNKQAQQMSELKDMAHGMMPIMEKLRAMFASLFARFPAEEFAGKMDEVLNVIANRIPDALTKIEGFFTKMKAVWGELSKEGGFFSQLKEWMPIIKILAKFAATQAIGAMADQAAGGGYLGSIASFGAESMASEQLGGGGMFNTMKGLFDARGQISENMEATKKSLEGIPDIMNAVVGRTTAGVGAAEAAAAKERVTAPLKLEVDGKVLGDAVVEIVGTRVMEINVLGA